MIHKLRNKAIIINSDLDGIISGLFLHKFLNCKIVGFTNSKEYVWFNEGLNIPYAEVVFVDIFIANPEVVCIDQHIISANRNHYNRLEGNENKLNPNLLNERFHAPTKSYIAKYPFGTAHFILALIENKGIDTASINLKNIVEGISFIDLLLRADDTMKTTIDSRYIVNAQEWWNWLEDLSGDGYVTVEMILYLKSLSEESASFIKDEIGKKLTSKPFNCDTSDGGIQDLTLNGLLKDSVKCYLKFMCQISQIEGIDVEANYTRFRGYSERMKLSNDQIQEIIKKNTIDGRKLFSYAFVKSVLKERYFSATFYQPK